ncbi:MULTISPECIES: pentapeptide repeat-containing protein [unclassified Microbulbifer]|uniref:pentapeptide repeat-containing protein n=1 Tax=unclassified Microbulbifer TaxID=2619833 RepID=UPI0027E458B5|nr:MULTISPECIES: pentapeptide repeat-containing protein [unclassified Microbulbifer]
MNMIEVLEKIYRQGWTVRGLVVESCDLKMSNFQSMRADGLQLAGIDLTDSNLSNVHWRNCRLRNVCVEDSSFRDGVLRLCTLESVQASNADFSRAVFENSKACGCIFDNADFAEVSLVDSDFSRASLRNVNFQRASASGACFRGADLRGAKLCHADLEDVDFRGADLTGASLESANLQGADFRGALLDDSASHEEPGGDFSPAFREATAAAGPLVAALLREGENTGLLDSDTVIKLTEQLQSQLGVESVSSPPTPELDRILRSIVDTGVTPLIEALRQGEQAPSDTVATMLKNLSDDLGLDNDATAEDLLARLVTVFRSPESDIEKE